jgi:GNAT superfamily N-acetyltransferase
MFIYELFDRTKRAHRGGIDLEAFGGNGEFQINAESHGKRLGQVLFLQYGDKQLEATDLWVDEDYRGQGIAAVMYDYAKELGYRVERSDAQTAAGKHFWDKNRGEEGRVWEDSVNEITMVPSVAKSKQEHLDVMPNDGKPIKPGDEEHYMGERVGKLGHKEVWTYRQGPMTTFVVFDPESRVSQLAVTGSSYPDNPDSLIIKGVYSGPKNATRAANLYAWLVTRLGLTLVSDIKQSPGGYRVWQDMERRFGRHMNVYAFNTKTDEPLNLTTLDEPETHVDQEHLPGATRDIKDVAKNVRLVASPK